MRRAPPEAWLLATYALWWVGWSVAPLDRLVWVFENLLVAVGLPILILTHRSFRFSTGSYVAMFAFLCVHAVGAHYGYSKVPVPWEAWGFTRNHSDRAVHFLFGALAVRPVGELLVRLGRVRQGWDQALAVTATFALAALFEVIEWLAVLVGGDLTGPSAGGYLGTQGDEFDAIKDMALGLVGALATTATLLAVGRLRRPAKPPGAREAQRGA